MKALTISDAPIIVLGLQDEIRRNAEARYDHRLHGVHLVAQGLNCYIVAELLGDSPRTVEYWVRRFDQKDLPVCKKETAPVVLAALTRHKYRKLMLPYERGHAILN
jgi:hypothetical protein